MWRKLKCISLTKRSKSKKKNTYILYASNNMTFWKGKTSEMVKKMSGHQGLETREGEINSWSTGD